MYGQDNAALEACLGITNMCKRPWKWQQPCPACQAQKLSAHALASA